MNYLFFSPFLIQVKIIEDDAVKQAALEREEDELLLSNELQRRPPSVLSPRSPPLSATSFSVTIDVSASSGSDSSLDSSSSPPTSSASSPRSEKAHKTKKKGGRRTKSEIPPSSNGGEHSPSLKAYFNSVKVESSSTVTVLDIPKTSPKKEQKSEMKSPRRLDEKVEDNIESNEIDFVPEGRIL